MNTIKLMRETVQVQGDPLFFLRNCCDTRHNPNLVGREFTRAHSLDGKQTDGAVKIVKLPNLVFISRMKN